MEESCTHLHRWGKGSHILLSKRSFASLYMVLKLRCWRPQLATTLSTTTPWSGQVEASTASSPPASRTSLSTGGRAGPSSYRFAFLLSNNSLRDFYVSRGTDKATWRTHAMESCWECSGSLLWSPLPSLTSAITLYILPKMMGWIWCVDCANKVWAFRSTCLGVLPLAFYCTEMCKTSRLSSSLHILKDICLFSFLP